MAVTYISASSAAGGSSSTSITCSPPASIADGNLLVARVSAYGSTTVTLTPPAGWTQESSALSTADGGNHRIFLCWKFASGESGDYVFTYSVSVFNQVAIVQYSGVDGTTPLDVIGTSASGNSTTATASTVTTVTDGAMLLFWASNVNEVISATPPGGMTERGEWTNLYMADEERATAGSTGTRQITITADPWSALLVALRPGDPPPPPPEPSFVGAGAAAVGITSGTGVSPALPAGLQQDDLMVMVVAVNNNTDISTPSGWTEILASNQNNTSLLRVEVFVKWAGASESAPTGVAAQANTVWRMARIFAIRGCDSSLAADASGVIPAASRSNNAASSTTLTFATITPGADDTRLVAFGITEDDFRSWTALSGFGAFDIDFTTSGNDEADGVAHRTWADGASSTGGLTSTISAGGGTVASSVNVGLLFAFAPAAAAVPFLEPVDPLAVIALM